MQIKILIISMAVALIFASSSANAASSPLPEDITFGTIKNLIEEQYNPNSDALPSAVKALIGNERINVYIDELSVGLVTENAKVTEIKNGELANPSVKVTTKKSVIAAIMNSTDPGAAAKGALNSGEIKITGVGILNWLKFSASNLLMWLASLFGY